jgi:hypothetical protein
MNNKYSLNPVLLGVVLALAFVVVGTAVSQPALVDGTGLLNLEEEVEAENATMPGAANQITTSENTTGVEFLSIQSAQSGSLSQINETAYTLELNDIANKTIMFSDRPNRIVETVSTSDFVSNWTTGPDSFAVDEPNDALIVENTETGELETAIIESFNPVYDSTANTLTYTIMAENGTSVNLPSEFGQSVVVVDAESIIMTGHSRGTEELIEVYTFASPRVGGLP